MPDLKDEFDVIRGDLLYGQSADRGTALEYLQDKHTHGEFIEDAMEAGAWVTVDNFNIPIGNESKYSHAQTAQNLWAQVKAERNATAQSLDTALAPKWGDDVKPLNQAYQDRTKAFLKGLKHSNLSPERSLNAPADKLEREGWNDPAKDRYYLAIRRACKFGIEHVAANVTGDAKIHFVLNRFDQGSGWVDVLQKNTITSPRTGRTTMLITYSELRYVYKHWNTFSPRVRFYRYLPAALTPNTPATSFPSCPAPWEDDSRHVDVPKDDLLNTPPKTVTLRQLWSQYYGPKKARAYHDLVERLQRTSPRYAARKMEVDNWFDLANISIEFDSENAIFYYKRCVEALR